MLETGIKAPEFTLKNQDGEEVSLKDFLGKKVILYFYPKDNTPGCTTQACSFGDMYPQIREKGAVVLGVSKDSVASHKKFADKYGLPFTLLSDPELEVIQKYDVWQEKNMYGKKVMGVVRSTYLIADQPAAEYGGNGGDYQRSLYQGEARGKCGADAGNLVTAEQLFRPRRVPAARYGLYIIGKKALFFTLYMLK